MSSSPTNSSKNIQTSPDNIIDNHNTYIFNELFKRLSTLTDQEEIDLVLKSLIETKTATASHHSQNTTIQSDSQNSRATKASGDTNQLFGCSSIIDMPPPPQPNNSLNINEIGNNNDQNYHMNDQDSATTSAGAINPFPLLNERSISDTLSIVSQHIGKKSWKN